MWQVQPNLLIGRSHRENYLTNKELIFAKKWKPGIWRAYRAILSKL